MTSPSSAHRLDPPPSTTSTLPLPSSFRACAAHVDASGLLPSQLRAVNAQHTHRSHEGVVLIALDGGSLAPEAAVAPKVSAHHCCQQPTGSLPGHYHAALHLKMGAIICTFRVVVMSTGIRQMHVTQVGRGPSGRVCRGIDWGICHRSSQLGSSKLTRSARDRA